MSAIFRGSRKAKILWEGVTATGLIGPVEGAASVCLNEVDVAPGYSIPAHTHDCEEAMFVIGGNGIMTIGSEEIALSKDQVVLVPAGAVHTTVNTGAAETLKLLSFYPAATPKRNMV